MKENLLQKVSLIESKNILKKAFKTRSTLILYLRVVKQKIPRYQVCVYSQLIQWEKQIFVLII